ncbi:motility protein A [Atopococcus tabaci]|uniref:motility protein A n=1 Tax=Atopococcus tabaci TaxID=269774 RepID=UPI0003F62D3D|nr:motility protein A [Atopococcus tabaci]
MKKNFLPLFGILLGFGLVIWSISQSGPLAAFVDVPSIIITVFGSFAAVLISYPLKALKNVPALLKQLVLSPKQDRIGLISAISDLSKKVRRNGILSIEDDINEFDNEVLVHGLQMVVDGNDGESIREILELELEQIENRHSIGHSLFSKWGEYAPAFGMIGTLIGLIVMLGELEDPSTIGTGMATALLTTFYGTMLANLVLLPIATNLKAQTEEEVTTSEMIIEGVLALQEGQNPRIIQQKLTSFLTTEERKALEEEEQASVLELGRQEG